MWMCAQSAWGNESPRCLGLMLSLSPICRSRRQLSTARTRGPTTDAAATPIASQALTVIAVGRTLVDTAPMVTAVIVSQLSTVRASTTRCSAGHTAYGSHRTRCASTNVTATSASRVKPRHAPMSSNIPDCCAPETPPTTQAASKSMVTAARHTASSLVGQIRADTRSRRGRNTVGMRAAVDGMASDVSATANTTTAAPTAAMACATPLASCTAKRYTAASTTLGP
mmetsp:Transcript_15531/g.48053  ORF Transcript_15531/g.48053 Transcript_15531/m.48053 type:complete len:226 (-) Transcript_15531:834-1511(-)